MKRDRMEMVLIQKGVVDRVKMLIQKGVVDRVKMVMTVKGLVAQMIALHEWVRIVE